jgi:streptogramin lyase
VLKLSEEKDHTMKKTFKKTLRTGTLLMGMALASAHAADFTVTGPDGRPLPLVMVTRITTQSAAIDDSDNGYAASGKLQQGAFEHTRFSDAQGRVRLPDAPGDYRVRLRKPGYQDALIEPAALGKPASWRMAVESGPKALAEQRPSNAWTSTLLVGRDDLRKEFMAQCGFCHQQGSSFLRRERSAAEWATTIQRMVRYGARLSTQAQKELPALLEAHWKDINAHPEKVPAGTPWVPVLAKATITELPIGDRFSQMHDFVQHSNGLVYVGDNLQDRLYEINTQTGAYTVYKVPPQPGDNLGGLLAGRLRDFPKHETYQGIHSLVEAPTDGHIFITPSYQRRLIEFDPKTKQFINHEIGSGFYPHTVRMDAKNRVWFTLALSNQIGMLDRASGKFATYDLPFRSFMEKVTVKLTPFFFKLIGWGLPVTNWVKIDNVSTGVPLPYGIDLTPDGKVWVARLHTQEIACLDPDTGTITMIATPLKNPRRLRSDRDGNLWIGMFSESAVLRYEPRAAKFTQFDLPVQPVGSDTPYSLNVDRKRHQVWVTGTNSDGVHRLDIASGQWTHFPLPRKATFTRDVEFTEDGRVLLTNGSFPSWHIEDYQPTFIQLNPLGAAR